MDYDKLFHVRYITGNKNEFQDYTN